MPFVVFWVISSGTENDLKLLIYGQITTKKAVLEEMPVLSCKESSRVKIMGISGDNNMMDLFMKAYEKNSFGMCTNFADFFNRSYLLGCFSRYNYQFNFSSIVTIQGIIKEKITFRFFPLYIFIDNQSEYRLKESLKTALEMMMLLSKYRTNYYEGICHLSMCVFDEKTKNDFFKYLSLNNKSLSFRDFIPSLTVRGILYRLWQGYSLYSDLQMLKDLFFNKKK